MPQPTNPVQEVLYRNRRKRFRINSGCLYESSAARHHHLVENKEGPLGTQQILKNKLATTENPREELDNRSVVGEREERIRTNSSTVTFLRLAQSDLAGAKGLGSEYARMARGADFRVAGKGFSNAEVNGPVPRNPTLNTQCH